ncbi:MAG: NUDIX hydrolase [Candidatus Nanohalobium sp.]
MEGEVAIGVIRNKGKFLVMKRSEETSSSGLWTFPGGRIEESDAPDSISSGNADGKIEEETVEEAALREIKEETGLEPEVLRTGESYMNTGELGEWKIFPVLMESSSREVDMNHEHSEFRWIELGELEGLETLGKVRAPEKLGLE